MCVVCRGHPTDICAGGSERLFGPSLVLQRDGDGSGVGTGDADGLGRLVGGEGRAGDVGQGGEAGRCDCGGGKGQDGAAIQHCYSPRFARPPSVEAVLETRLGKRLGSGGAGQAERGQKKSPEIGTASCRERVCQYVEISVVAGALKKKKKKK